jgi:YtkA-like
MKKWLLAMVMILVFCSACTNDKKEEAKAEKSLEPINVEVKTNPETIKVNEKIEIQAIVTQGTDKVTDADDVEFEIAKKGEKSEKILGKHKADGVYVVEKTFDSEGVYEVTPHTNARGLHVMPTVEIKVGNVEHKAEGHGNGHGKSETALYFMAPKDVKVNADATLTMHVKHKNEALAGAKAKFEIWKEGNEKHEFVEAKETKAGEYQAVTKFAEAGTYNVILHVEKGEIHEHTQEKVEVK